MLWHGAQYHKGFFGCPFACPILQLNFLESFPFSRTCICLQAIWIFVFWICYLWQSIGNEPEIDMINRFCRQRTKTRTFLCFKCFLSGYFEYQVHLNIYQNTKIDAYRQTIILRDQFTMQHMCFHWTGSLRQGPQTRGEHGGGESDAYLNMDTN